MSKVIVYTQENGQVAVCIPTSEMLIDEVLAKDCPVGAIIVDESVLPQGEDANYFDAWELVNGVVVVNEAKKSAIQAAQLSLETAKTSGLSKLTALGLTPDEITALVGK